MKRLFVAISTLLLAFLFTSDGLSQPNEQRILECLVGTTLNNPLLLEMLKDDDYSITKYSFSENDCRIGYGWDGAILIEDGVIERIYNGSSEYKYKYLPKSWGIKWLYKDMKRTDKSYPKQPKHEIGNYVHISKKVGDIVASLTYKYRTVDTDYGEKWKMVFTNFVLTAYDGNTNCGEIPPPPSVYPSILGADGENLPRWICENFGEPVSDEWLDANFVHVYMVEDYELAPSFYEGGYYAHHPIFDGEYYLSQDAAVLLRIKDGLLNGIGFYAQMIDRDILERISKDTYRQTMIDRYGDQDTDYMIDDDEYFLRTPGLELMFHFDYGLSLDFVWINQLFFDGKLDISEEFPLRDHKEGYCFSGDCENGFGSFMDSEGRLSEGKWYYGTPIETHKVQYRYGVIKDEYYLSVQGLQWEANRLKAEEERRKKELEEEEKLQRRIDMLEDVPDEYKDQMYAGNLSYDHTEVVMLVAGTNNYESMKIESYCHYGVFAVAEADIVLDLELFVEGRSKYNQLSDSNLAFVFSNFFFADDSDGLLTIKLDGNAYTGHEYPVKLVFYKAQREEE